MRSLPTSMVKGQKQRVSRKRNRDFSYGLRTFRTSETFRAKLVQALACFDQKPNLKVELDLPGKSFLPKSQAVARRRDGLSRGSSALFSSLMAASSLNPSAGVIIITIGRNTHFAIVISFQKFRI